MSAVSALDVAQYILREAGPMNTWKLQKLVYYSQAWHLVWDDEPLFTERIEAWANGPVVRKLYRAHRGEFQVASILGGKIARLSKDQRETIGVVLKTYGGKSGRWLSALTHRERPWRETRRKAGLAAGDRGSAVITFGSMSDYYGSL